MRLSTTDIYALHALAFLGTQETGRWVGSDAISEATGIARPYLVRILATLSNNHIISSKKGTGGGYALAKDASELNLRDVMRAIDGPVAPLSCVSLNWGKACPEEKRCNARNNIWLKVRDAMLAALAEVSVADLAQDFDRGVNYHLCLEHLLSPNA
ncbi:MAG: Rrf2 family transcriptional regulator [Trueperaceae bacterium]|nr:Rrf2 family transcriptional regulator [Trueperaceae bacterium]